MEECRTRRFIAGTGFVLALLAALGLAGCAARTPVAAPTFSAADFPAAERQPYRLQVGDAIAVMFWGNEELDQELIIRPDGFISLPFVDEVEAAGLTPAELDTTLSSLYKSELTTPDITVIVREVVGQEIFVGGEVAEQGSVPVRGGITVYQAIQAAGGFMDTARRQDVILIRTMRNGERIAARLDMMPVVQGSDFRADIKLQASDVIFVPRVTIISFTKFLERYFYDLLPIRIVGTVDLFGDEGIF